MIEKKKNKQDLFLRGNWMNTTQNSAIEKKYSIFMFVGNIKDTIIQSDGFPIKITIIISSLAEPIKINRYYLDLEIKILKRVLKGCLFVLSGNFT